MSRAQPPRADAERWLALVPTLGRSDLLADSVAALRREGGRVLVVAPRGALPEGWPDGWPDGWRNDRPDDSSDCEAAERRVEVLRTDGALGFAAANVAALEAAPRTDYVALVNDDAVVEEGWAAALVAELDAQPRCAAAQGVVTSITEPAVDGAGLAWNGWWQAVQIGRGEPVDALRRMIQVPTEVFGVSATAAMYRRSALDEVGPLFDEALGSYYEDVDLAVRLRAAGWSARLVPAARARHAGSTTGRHLGAGRLVRRNRYAVLARTLGTALLPRLPKVVLRDAIDALHAALRSEPSDAAAIVRGTAAGLLRLPFQLRRKRLPAAELRRWTEMGR